MKGTLKTQGNFRTMQLKYFVEDYKLMLQFNSKNSLIVFQNCVLRRNIKDAFLHTLLPSIHAQTAHFCNWLGGFVCKCMHIMRVQVRAPIYEARIGQIISKRRDLKGRN